MNNELNELLRRVLDPGVFAKLAGMTDAEKWQWLEDYIIGLENDIHDQVNAEFFGSL
jgi:hypothetical protein